MNINEVQAALLLLSDTHSTFGKHKKDKAVFCDDKPVENFRTSLWHNTSISFWFWEGCHDKKVKASSSYESWNVSSNMLFLGHQSSGWLLLFFLIKTSTKAYVLCAVKYHALRDDHFLWQSIGTFVKDAEEINHLIITSPAVMPILIHFHHW